MGLADDYTAAAAAAAGHATSVDSHQESIGIDLTQVPGSRDSFATKHLVGFFGDHLSCNVIGCLGNHLCCTVERDFCHSSVALSHYNHATIEEYPDWILDDHGNHAWDYAAEDLSSTERAARSWQE